MIIQNAPVDPLSDVLRLVGAETACSVRLTTGGDWSLRFVPPALKFNAIRRGACWLIPEGEAPVRLNAGDSFVVVRRPFVLTSDPALPSVDAAAVFAGPRISAGHGSGDDVDILGGSVTFTDAAAADLVDLLPPAMVISGDGESPIAWLLDQLDREWRSAQPGAETACNDLLRLMFVHAMRRHLQEAEPAAQGWLAGLGDPPVAAALRAIHAEPQRVWRLPELAKAAGLSRSGFAERFRDTVGLPPIEYAARWRMRVAADRLQRGGATVSAVAGSLGFLSDSAFGVAFRRVHGVSPGRYRSARQTLAA